MFNLLISSNPESWNSSPIEFDKSRVAIEYTVDEISERYKFLDETAINELLFTIHFLLVIFGRSWNQDQWISSGIRTYFFKTDRGSVR